MTTTTKRPAAAKSTLPKDRLIPAAFELAKASESEREALIIKINRAVETAFEKQQPKKQLKAIWEETKEKSNPDIPTQFSNLIERPRTLRGRDFYNELLRLSVLTGDERFSDAVMPLIEHGIIKKKNFTRWRDPTITELEAHKNRNSLRNIRKLIKDGWSIRRACAATAALYGVRANSFAAAIKQLELLYAGKKGAA
jgi:hypothetical protein